MMRKWVEAWFCGTKTMMAYMTSEGLSWNVGA